MTGSRRSAPSTTAPARATQEPRVVAAEAALASIPAARVTTVLAATAPSMSIDRTQNRIGEEYAAVDPISQLLAIVTSPWFWELMRVLPRNDLTRQWPGRPQHYPDWLLFLLSGCVSAITNVCSQRAAVAIFDQPRIWALFAAHVDRYVPEGMTRIADLTGDSQLVV